MSLKRRFRNDPGIPAEHPLKNAILEEARLQVAEQAKLKERLRAQRIAEFNRQQKAQQKASQKAAEAAEAQVKASEYNVLRDGIFDEVTLIPSAIVEKQQAEEVSSDFNPHEFPLLISFIPHLFVR
eukprot:m.66953 g.66953  ORF g.66953 m.66953 type:complete len:126 (+) comp49919_c0_seq4:305-682(+)